MKECFIIKRQQLAPITKSRSQYSELIRLTLGGTLTFLGITKVLCWHNQSPMMDIPDPVFGMSFRHLLFAIGLAQLGTACIFMFSEGRIWWLCISSWLFLNYSVYRIAAWYAGWFHPYNDLSLMSRAFKFSPGICDAVTVGMIFTFILGLGVLVWSGRETSTDAEFWKMFCPTCGGKIQFALKNIGLRVWCPHCQGHILLRKTDKLKMACFFCQEHIEFPAHAVGTKMPCPHCKMDITLRGTSVGEPIF